jgi:hypothetical protein
MTIFASSAARFLLQAVAAHDTVIMRQVPPLRSWFEQVVFVASGISTLLVLVLIAGLVVAMFAVRRSVQRAHEALDRRIADFGRRVDDFNDLLGKVHRRAETVVEVGGMAMDGIAWGAKKLGDRRRRRRKSRADKAAAAGGTTGAARVEAQVEAPLDDRRDDDGNDNERDSPYDDSSNKRK